MVVPRQDSAVPTEIVPDGHVVATVMYSSSSAMYPVGHDVDGVLANVSTGTTQKNNIMFFISNILLLCQISHHEILRPNRLAVS